MRNGTKIGLAAIGLACLAASTAISAHFIAKARNEHRIHIRFTDTLRACGSMPAGAGSQGGLWVRAPAAHLRPVGGALS